MVEVVSLSSRDPRSSLVRDQVWCDQSGTASLGKVMGKPVNAIAQNGIPVGHHQGRRAGRGNGAHGGEDVPESGPTLERDIGSVLDDRAVHQRVAGADAVRAELERMGVTVTEDDAAAETGANYTMTPCLSPLARFRDWVDAWLAGGR